MLSTHIRQWQTPLGSSLRWSDDFEDLRVIKILVYVRTKAKSNATSLPSIAPAQAGAWCRSLINMQAAFGTGIKNIMLHG